MKKILLGIIFVLLSVSFLISLGVVGFTIKYPQTMQNFLSELIPSVTPQPTAMQGVAVLGDSQSDEYRADDNRGQNFSSLTLNWVEILVQKRMYNFGVWGEWQEPRRKGYAYNFARTGATTRSMIESGQHTGVAEHVRSGAVNVVIVYIGAIDYAPFITENGYEKIYNNELSEAEIIEKRNHIVADIKTALDVIETAGNPKVVLITIPDWGNNIGVQAVFPLPDERNKVTHEINKTNVELKTIAKDRGYAVIDPNEFFKSVTENGSGTKVQVGNVTLERLLLNNDPKNMFLEDGVHTGTVLNGLFANEILKTLRTEFGIQTKELKSEEILDIAGIN